MIPPGTVKNVKMRNFCNGFSKMMMSTFKKNTAYQIWGNYFIVKNIGFLHNMLPPQYCVTGPRWVNKLWLLLFYITFYCLHNLYTTQTFCSVLLPFQSGTRFNIRQDVLSWDTVKPRSQEIGSLNHGTSLKFDRHLDSTVVELPVIFLNHRMILNTNPAASRLREMLQ